MTAMIMCVCLAIKSELCLTCGVAAIMQCPDILLSLSHNLQFFTVAGLQCYCSTVPMTLMGTTPASVSKLSKMKLIILKVPTDLTVKQGEY